MAAEVEGEIRASGWVEDVCVLGLPDAEWGQQVVAVVVPKTGIPKELEMHLKQHLSRQLSPFKHPQALAVVYGDPAQPSGQSQPPTTPAVGSSDVGDPNAGKLAGSLPNAQTG
jgi:O-succinylbenzoic acid--CoA ligase